MSTVRTALHSALPPTEVVRVLTDFGPPRAEVWPGVDADHRQVHDSGPGWAVVTDAAFWGLGSRWDYALTPEGSGTKVDVTLVRHGKGLKGLLAGALLPLIGRRIVKASFAAPLRAAQPTFGA